VLGAGLVEGGEVTACQVIEAATDRVERALVGEDLGGLFQRLVLVDRRRFRAFELGTWRFAPGRPNAHAGDRDRQVIEAR
jgi:hypothetical protein